MKQIIFVIGTMGNGGAERVISILSDKLIKKGYKVLLIAIYGHNVTYDINDKIEYIPLECKSKNKIFRVIERVYRLRKIFKENKKTKIVSFLADVNIYSIISNIFIENTIIISERNDPKMDPKSKKIRMIRDYLYRFADGIVFQTNDAKEYFSNKINKKGIIIKNPIKDGLPFVDDNVKNNEIVAIGRLSEQKNYPLMIEAFSRLVYEYEDYELIIYGEGPQEKNLKELVNEKNLNDKVKFLGFKKDIHDRIIKSKIFIMSSDYEGISNSMLEAMAMGLPVITTDYSGGGARETIKNYENGLLIKVKDCDDMYNKIKLLIENKNLYDRISINSRKIRYELNPENVATQWINYISEIGI
ncbi:glycosyltransferase [uncultured Clostridium sp.]|uniref:glycosyltransferase n=1 Tax=uncultured Clostridium sp. TaxID=59620 RepID=UPI002589413B|nr:glycosyltransferase [uncultured Clostridium sp.]